LKSAKTRILKWILEQHQDRRIPLVPKLNIFGDSAREVGTLPSETDLKIEQIQQIEFGQNESIFIQACDDLGSWLILRLTLFGNRQAKINLQWTNSVILNCSVLHHISSDYSTFNYLIIGNFIQIGFKIGYL
jgi:hypothetical protein